MCESTKGQCSHRHTAASSSSIALIRAGSVLHSQASFPTLSYREIGKENPCGIWSTLATGTPEGAALKFGEEFGERISHFDLGLPLPVQLFQTFPQEYWALVLPTFMTSVLCR